MGDYDIHISGGTIVDGTGVPGDEATSGSRTAASPRSAVAPRESPTG